MRTAYGPRPTIHLLTALTVLPAFWSIGVAKEGFFAGWALVAPFLMMYVILGLSGILEEREPGAFPLTAKELAWTYRNGAIWVGVAIHLFGMRLALELPGFERLRWAWRNEPGTDASLLLLITCATVMTPALVAGFRADRRFVGDHYVSSARVFFAGLWTIVGIKVGCWYPHMCDCGHAVIELGALFGTPILAQAIVLFTRRVAVGAIVAGALVTAVGLAANPYLAWIHHP